jgi:DNA helicase-2/ATP-dependent DNA helicase PcrA
MPGMEDGLFPGFKSMDSDDGIEEERRLCYVGMTRAREKLILTSAGYRVNFGRGDYTKESMFLDEIDKKYLEVHGNAFRPSRREEERRLKTMDWELDGFAKPFRGAAATDPFRAVKEEIKKGNVTETLTPGDRVTHPKFGFGIVTGVTGKIVEVNFESVGTKKLALGLAPLKKV